VDDSTAALHGNNRHDEAHRNIAQDMILPIDTAWR
jgi:hypothetical protein